MAELEEWWSPSQAATRLGVTPLRVRQLLSAGRIRRARTALGRLLDPADVERLAQERRKAGSKPRAVTGAR